MKALAVVAISICITGAFGKTFYSCNWISQANVDCTHFAPEKYCGNNRVTYDNKCYFSQAHCLDTDIDLLHEGECTSVDSSTPAPVAAGGEVVFDFFCTSLSHIDCPTTMEEVCASDGVTYRNLCEYEKQKCTHRNLHVQTYGSCI